MGTGTQKSIGWTLLCFIMAPDFFLSCQCTSSSGNRSKENFINNNSDVSVQDWDGWKVSEHPDNGYKWIEHKCIEKRIYISRSPKRQNALLVKIYVNGVWKLIWLDDINYESDSLFFMNPDKFKEQSKWLFENDIIYLYGTESALYIQTTNFALQKIRNGEEYYWKDWSGVFL